MNTTTCLFYKNCNLIQLISIIKCAKGKTKNKPIETMEFDSHAIYCLDLTAPVSPEKEGKIKPPYAYAYFHTH